MLARCARTGFLLLALDTAVALLIAAVPVLAQNGAPEPALGAGGIERAGNGFAFVSDGPTGGAAPATPYDVLHPAAGAAGAEYPNPVAR